jgi:hypothetical protein
MCGLSEPCSILERNLQVQECVISEDISLLWCPKVGVQLNVN